MIGNHVIDRKFFKCKNFEKDRLIQEVFDAGKPFEPGGCFAQAWSIATTLELMDEIQGKNR